MNRGSTASAALRPFLCGVLLAVPLAAASIQTTKPEDVGFSAERLNRIHDAVQRHIDAHDISGAVTLVARRRRVAHFDAQGVMDLDSSKHMAKDDLFWIASMTKPIRDDAVMMLLETAILRPSVPLSTFIPELRGLKVAEMQELHGPSTQDGASDPQFYTVPATREITIRDLLTHT